MVLDHFKVFSPGYQYLYEYKMGDWDGRESLIEEEMFPTGLIERLVRALAYYEIPYNVSDARNISTIKLHNSSVKLRDYQADAIDKALTHILYGTWWPRGVLEIATGGGKTEMAADLILKTRLPTIFLVHRKDLVDQTIDRFNKYGIDVGELDELGNTLVTVTTVQKLISWNNKGEDLSHLDNVGQIFFDEAHLASGTSFQTASHMLPNAFMRWGLTATAFMRTTKQGWDRKKNKKIEEAPLFDWRLEGATGSSIVKISNRQLIDAGHLSECEVDMYVMKPCEVPESLRGWPQCYDYYIVGNKKRNEMVAQAFRNYLKPCLILVSKVKHGELISAATGLPFLSGETDQDTRRETIRQLRAGELDGVVASTIFDEGVDITNIQTVILAGGGKSEIKNLQRLGRGLRVAKGKAVLQLVDFFDRSPKILANHSKIRQDIWEEQGFKISVKTLA
jgi:superfamily II DNA or RNA helicase